MARPNSFMPFCLLPPFCKKLNDAVFHHRNLDFKASLAHRLYSSDSQLSESPPIVLNGPILTDQVLFS